MQLVLYQLINLPSDLLSRPNAHGLVPDLADVRRGGADGKGAGGAVPVRVLEVGVVTAGPAAAATREDTANTKPAGTTPCTARRSGRWSPPAPT